MGHDATKVLMGGTKSSIREVSNHIGDIAAGLCVHLKSDDTLSLASADGSKIGISMGKDLSNAGRTAIARKGLKVPIQVTDGFDPAVGAAVQISTTTGKAVTSGTTVNASYAEVGLTGVMEDGTEVDCALIDMPGGL